MPFTPHDPEEQVPLADVLELEQLNESTWRSTHGTVATGQVPYKGKLRPAALGGCVLGQSAWAAAQSVPAGFVLHNLTGHWTAPARPDYAATFSVTSLQNGKSFQLRNVIVTQVGTDGPCFECTCSFKRPEPDAYDYQIGFDMRTKYESVLEGQLPSQFPMTKQNAGVFLNGPSRENKAGIGSIIGRIPMDAYNSGRRAEDRRQLYPYSWVEAEKLPSFASSPNMHIAGHIFCCDRESARSPAIHLGQINKIASVSSLAIMVIVHASTDVLAGCDVSGKPRWFYQEVRTDRGAEGRSVSHSKIFDEGGRHLFTTIQDCAMRPRKGGNQVQQKGLIHRL